MAQNNESKTLNTELIQLVTFKLDKEEYGVDIFKVREINKMMQITKVPNSPSFVEGVVNLRGKVTPVIDLRARLGLMQSVNTEKTSIIVAELSRATVGMIVDEVREVLRIPSDITEPPPPIVAGIDSDYITSVAKLEKRLLILLDLNRILNFTEEEQLMHVA